MSAPLAPSLRRIVDLPQGGGAGAGADIWFTLALADGAAETLALDRRLLPALLNGLRLFAAEADRLAGQAGLSERPLAAQVRAKPAEGGRLRLEVACGPEPLGLDLDRPAVKRLLVDLLAALAPPASPTLKAAA